MKIVVLPYTIPYLSQRRWRGKSCRPYDRCSCHSKSPTLACRSSTGSRTTQPTTANCCWELRSDTPKTSPCQLRPRVEQKWDQTTSNYQYPNDKQQLKNRVSKTNELGIFGWQLVWWQMDSREGLMQKFTTVYRLHSFLFKTNEYL